MMLSKLSLIMDLDSYDSTVGYVCPHCDSDININDFSNRSNLRCFIGYIDAPFIKNIEKTKAIVYECPKCFDKAWYHVSDKYIEILDEILEFFNK